jgi:hypothetical protein
MSYSIYIGQMVWQEYAEEDKEDYDAPGHWAVDAVQDENAPDIPDDFTTRKGNDRHPSYHSWHEFCKETGLMDLFFNKEKRLMREHSGCFPIANEHGIAIHQALVKYQNSHPDAQPRFNSSIEDAHLARLVWLDYWVIKTLETCPKPGIENY